MKELDNVRFNSQGLIPAIVQDYKTNQVLMLAWMNREALEQTFSTGKAHFWSRSRQKLWLKGESSGHYQLVRQVFIDCDADAVLIKAEQIEAACHEGYKTCFFREVVSDGSWKVVEEKVFEPGEVYR